MSKLANFENKNGANSVRIQTLISTLKYVIVNIIQNINLMNHMDKIGSSDNSICFSLLHLNIRNLNRNYDNLINCLASIKNKFSVIGISETWLAHADHAVDIDGYNFVHNHRPNRPGGDVGMYIDADLEFKFRDDNWSQFPYMTVVIYRRACKNPFSWLPRVNWPCAA